MPMRSLRYAHLPLWSWQLGCAAIFALGVAAGCMPAKSQGDAAGAPLASAGRKPIPPPPGGRITPVARYGHLVVRGAQLATANGEPVTLRGQAFGWDNWWPQFYNADVVQSLRDDWCVDVVRPAMGIEPAGAYLSNPAAAKQRITAVVEAAIDAGVYVIIDWHAHQPHRAEAIAFFTEMAQRYGDHPHVLYEIFNEPEKDQSWQQVKDYATAVISAIRKHDPDNIVIVGSPEWDQRIDLVAADPLAGQSNIAYSVHFYAATHGQWLRDRTQAAIDAGIPVFVTESSGAEASGQGSNDYDEWQAWITFMEKNRISWLNYSVSDKAGETISVLKPGARASGGWSDAELTESGRYVRKLLRAHCK
ncbi:MAG TPA: glycoside hydrolase family 5 protein [Polyangiaceae bacterium]|nr:glycoside hydrolase family 5 protein [Polyangiaceae bacterium]